jgi:hypothetical protein
MRRGERRKKISRRQTIIHNATCGTTLDVPPINPSNLVGYFWLYEEVTRVV